MRTRTRLAVLTLAFAAAAPAVAAQETKAPQDSTQQKAARPRRGDRNRLTQDDIATAGGGATALDVIRRLRPQWLNPPPGRMASSNVGATGGGSTAIVLYVDDVRQPELEMGLQQVPLAKVFEIRYLDQNRAVQMRGPGHEAGVIEVTTTTRRR